MSSPRDAVARRVISGDPVLDHSLHRLVGPKFPFGLRRNVSCNEALGDITKMRDALSNPSSLQARVGLNGLACWTEMTAEPFVVEAQHDREFALCLAIHTGAKDRVEHLAVAPPQDGGPLAEEAGAHAGVDGVSAIHRVVLSCLIRGKRRC